MEDDRRFTFDKLFWQRQHWLMENRGADGLSHCNSDDEMENAGPFVIHSADNVPEGTFSEPLDMPTGRLGRDILRTAGVGLPLARVKQVMNSADPDIKVSRLKQIQSCRSC